MKKENERVKKREPSELNSAIIEGLAEGIVIYDRNLCYLVWNPFMEQLTGLTSDQVLGCHAPSLFPHISVYGLDVLIQRVLVGETLHSPDFPYSSTVKGTALWLSTVYAPYRSSDGEIIGVIGLIRDVTERRQTEQALRESEERNLYLSDLAFEGIVIQQNFIVVEANATFVRLIGHESLETVIGLNVLSMVDPFYVDMVERNAREGRETIYAVDIQRKDGSIFPAELNARKIFHKGQEARVVALRDITEQRKAEEALRMVEARYRRLFENAMVGIFQETVDGQ